MPDLNETRRRFISHFAGIGLGTTLAPGILWARLHDAGANTLTLLGTNTNVATYAGVISGTGGKLTKQYEESRLLHNRLQKGKGTKIGDRGVEIPTHLSGNYNHKFMADGGEFPVGGSNLSKRAKVFFKNLAGACRLTGAAIDSINSMDVAYVKDVLQWNLDESMSALYKMGNIYAHGLGDGKLATVSTAANGTSKTVTENDLNRFGERGLQHIGRQVGIAQHAQHEQP